MFGLYYFLLFLYYVYSVKVVKCFTGYWRNSHLNVWSCLCKIKNKKYYRVKYQKELKIKNKSKFEVHFEKTRFLMKIQIKKINLSILSPVLSKPVKM